MLKAARYYTKLGYRIFPLVERDKIPAIQHGYKSVFDIAPAAMLDYWASNPLLNIGLPTGAVNDLFVFDIDGEDGKKSLFKLESEFGILPRTATSVTANGKHLLFKFTDGLRNRARVMPGIDIRADGGYIVVPPSIHPSGRQYRWLHSISTTPIATAPQWLINRITYRDPIAIIERKLSGRFIKSNSPIQRGERNDRLYRMAFAAAMAGKSYQEILLEISEVNSERCVEMLSQYELETLVGSAIKGATGA